MLYSFIQNLRERLKGYKTIFINAMIGLPSALYALYSEFSSVDITPLIPAKYAAATVAVISIIGIILRIYTTGPLGSKQGLPNAR